MTIILQHLGAIGNRGSQNSTESWGAASWHALHVFRLNSLTWKTAVDTARKTPSRLSMLQKLLLLLPFFVLRLGRLTAVFLQLAPATVLKLSLPHLMHAHTARHSRDSLALPPRVEPSPCLGRPGREGAMKFHQIQLKLLDLSDTASGA